jgi:DNA-binding NarL/FixJ family response regulator
MLRDRPGGVDAGSEPTDSERGDVARIAPIRVLIVDEHPVVRGVVRTACESSSSLEVLGEAADSAGAFALSRDAPPDVVVLDPSGTDGFELTRSLRRGLPDSRLLVLTSRTDGETVLRCLRLGVAGVVSKAAGVHSIGTAIAAVARGEQVLPEELSAGAVAELGRLARTARQRSSIPTLTARELEVLRHLASGLTVGQTSTRIGVSPSTVESHVTKLYRKLGVRTRVQAIARAASLGLIDLDRMDESGA